MPFRPKGAPPTPLAPSSGPTQGARLNRNCQAAVPRPGLCRRESNSQVKRKTYTIHLPPNLVTGLSWGLWFACCYSAFALLMVLLRGPSLLAKYNTTLLGLIAAYFVGGLAAGAAVGLLSPWGRRRSGAALLGFVGAFLALYAIGIAMTPRASWLSSTPLVAAFCAAILGPILGISWWSDENRRQRP